MAPGKLPHFVDAEQVRGPFTDFCSRIYDAKLVSAETTLYELPRIQ